jgi:branched-subunit amino acid aminotransferase/4-amino-4-deoxychorismate lyase
MIWVGGQVVPDDALRVSVLDRTFEHGLGLFETLRTWNGRAPLLNRHFARMTGSARELGLPLDGVKLPDEEAVAALLQAEQVEGDVILRITLTGGVSDSTGATLWMRTAPLPPPVRGSGAVVALGLWTVEMSDPLARHKTLNYWSRRRAFEKARRLGYDETLSTTPTGAVWEGSRTNLFWVQGSTLVTPTLNGPIVPGVMRAVVLKAAAELPLQTADTNLLTFNDLYGADEVFLTNSVRGLVPVARVGDHSWPAPGDWTRRLSLMITDALSYRDEEE